MINSQFQKIKLSLFGYLLGVMMIVVLPVLLTGCGNGDEETGPKIHKEFPIKDPKNLSPPMVKSPIHECAEAVHIYSFIPHAKVEVYANQTEKIGEATPDLAFVDIQTSRPLKVGDKITATQTVNNIVSDHTIIPVVVKKWPDMPDGFNKPDVGDDLYECGVIVPVGNLVPSVKVHILEDNIDIGKADAPEEWKAVWTQPLHANRKVTAYQVACEGDPQTEMRSPEADPVTVKPAPNPMPMPNISSASLIVGNDAVTLSGLKVGAYVEVRDQGVKVGAGWATGSGNWVPIDPPISSNSSITAIQELCGNSSPETPPEKPTGMLEAPEVIAPICNGAQHVVVRKTTINATVVLFADGDIVGYSGAVNGDLIITLGGGRKLQTGEKVTAIQYMGQTLSPVSNSVTVVGQIEKPVVEVLGGHWFFNAEGNEQQINGSVFPRGRGDGPIIAITTCCSSGVKASVQDINGNDIAEITLAEIFPGYFTGQWPWTSTASWTIPGDIPVGQYSVTISAQCLNNQTVKEPFYIIFDPDEVNGPGRFSFNEIGVWFGAGSNADKGLLYHLHPDDKRIFDIAIKAANGYTKQIEAAKKIASAEEALFSYSLNYHTNDTLVLLNSYNSAQCADDANFLTGLLRAVGIPAHPATADADIETGNANWNFDTWTELLVFNNANPEWMILHPHEYPGVTPRTRIDFGTNAGVAMESTQDLIIMANENWDWNEANDNSYDVTYKRNSCKKPEQNINKKNWIYELCEGGYWTTNHWNCEGVGSSSSGLSAESEIDISDAGWGRRIGHRLTLTNLHPAKVFGSGTVELLFDLPESKLFPDKVIYTQKIGYELDGKATNTISNEIPLPRSRPAGYDMYLRTTVEDSVVALTPVKLEDYLTSAIKIEGIMQPGKTVTLIFKVTNTSKVILEDVRLDLRVPFALMLRDKEIPGIEKLQPDETKEFSFDVKVVAPIEAGSIILDVESANGGASRTMVPFIIEDSIMTMPAKRAVIKK